MAHRAFGRRADPNGAAGECGRAPVPRLHETAAGLADNVDVDPELQDWKRARRWQPPWRQIAFTASLCFGIGSLILPDTVNDGVQWLLYGLTAASLYAGWRKRRA